LIWASQSPVSPLTYFIFMLKKSCFTIIASMSQKMSKVDLFYAEYLKQKAVQPHVSRAVELIASFVNVDE
jgi:hypothetical protein